MKTLRLQVSLREVAPQVIRVLDVPAGSTLDEVHNLLQVAIGWTDSHLHQFVADDAVYATPHVDEWQPVVDERRVQLTQMPSAFRYDYDFGDGWEHDVTVLGPGGESPGVVYGEGACPPEDCGGPGGHAGLLADQALDSDFDQEAANALVRQSVGEVPASVRMILDLAAPGVKLTPGGRLPRAFVREVQELRPGWEPFGRPAATEDSLYPLVRLHDVLREVGLLRMSKGLLRPTKIAGNDLETVRRLRGWFAKDLFTDLLVGDALAVLIVRGPMSRPAMAAQLLEMLGGRWGLDGEPLTERDVELALSQHWALMVGLDLLEPDHQVLIAGPSARSLLVRATLLAELLTT